MKVNNEHIYLLKVFIEHLLHVAGCVRCGNTGEQARPLVPAWPVPVSKKMLNAEVTVRWRSPVVQFRC